MKFKKTPRRSREALQFQANASANFDNSCRLQALVRLLLGTRRGLLPVWMLFLLTLLAVVNCPAVTFVNTADCPTDSFFFQVYRHHRGLNGEVTSSDILPAFGGGCAYHTDLPAFGSSYANWDLGPCSVGCDEIYGIMLVDSSCNNIAWLPYSLYGPNPTIYVDCSNVLGATYFSISDPNDFPPNKQCKQGMPVGMPVWQVSEPYISLWLEDEPLGYQPACGPRISFGLNFKQREDVAGYDTNIFSTGPKWNCSWLSYVTVDTNAKKTVYFPGGGSRLIPATYDLLTNTRVTGDTTSGYTVAAPDGGTNIYGFIVTNNAGSFLKAFLTESCNPNGQKTRFYYDGYAATNPVVRLRFVVDGDGRTNTVSYTASNNYSTNLISQDDAIHLS